MLLTKLHMQKIRLLHKAKNGFAVKNPFAVKLK